MLSFALLLGLARGLAAQDAGIPQNDAEQVEQTPDQGQPTPQGIQGKAEENPAEPEAHGTRLRWQDIPKNVLHDQVAIFTSPFRINRDNAKWWGVFGGTTAVFIGGVDQRVSNGMPQENRFTKPSTWASRMGASYVLYPLWGTFYVVGKIGDRPRARDTARIGIEALIDADITANIIKVATQRPRPEIKGESVAFFQGGDAFPSGHSIKTWALARVAAREYPHPRIIPILAYGLASTVSIARVGGRRHSPSDALAGAAMGFFIGDYVYRHHHAPTENPRKAVWLFDHVTFAIGP
jgi:membrane-associated phospholipid phosphatase